MIVINGGEAEEADQNISIVDLLLNQKLTLLKSLHLNMVLEVLKTLGNM